jgi:hypothetical protein
VVEDLGHSEIFQVLVIHNNVYRQRRACQVVLPNAEGLKYSEKFLVVNIVVQLGRVEGAGVESNWMYFTVL